jgi:predicted CoA-binding protein
VKHHKLSAVNQKEEKSLSQNEIKEILSKYKTVAVVGLSREAGKDSNRVSGYLKQQGFHIIPVNPFADEILGEKSYKSLMDIPPEIQKTIEIVDIFRPAKDVPPIVEQAIKLKAARGKLRVVWMQLGIVNEQAAEAAKKAGLTVVMDKCMMVEHKRLF